MNWAWATSLDQLWHAPAFPMWVTWTAALAFALVLLVTLFRAEKSVANGALAVITLLAIAIAATATVRSFTTTGAGATHEVRTTSPALAALSCLDGLAGDVVENACERSLFASADTVAAAVSYTADQITRLAGYGDEAAANRSMTPELAALRRTVERDRYGFVARVLGVRDGCTPSDCAFFNSLSDHNQIAAAMSDRTYDGLVGRYASGWTAPTAAAGPGLASAPPTAAPVTVTPQSKPVSGDFPSSTSIPPVNIMTPEPAPKPAAAPRPAAATVAAPAAPPAAAPHNANAAAPAAKRPAPKKPPAAAPAAVTPAGPTPQRDPLAPSAQRDDN